MKEQGKNASTPTAHAKVLGHEEAWSIQRQNEEGFSAARGTSERQSAEIREMGKYRVSRVPASPMKN